MKHSTLIRKLGKIRSLSRFGSCSLLDGVCYYNQGCMEKVQSVHWGGTIAPPWTHSVVSSGVPPLPIGYLKTDIKKYLKIISDFHPTVAEIIKDNKKFSIENPVFTINQKHNKMYKYAAMVFVRMLWCDPDSVFRTIYMSELGYDVYDSLCIALVCVWRDTGRDALFHRGAYCEPGIKERLKSNSSGSVSWASALHGTWNSDSPVLMYPGELTDIDAINKFLKERM